MVDGYDEEHEMTVEHRVHMELVNALGVGNSREVIVIMLKEILWATEDLASRNVVNIDEFKSRLNDLVEMFEKNMQEVDLSKLTTEEIRAFIAPRT